MSLDPFSNDLPIMELPYAYGDAPVAGVLRQHPDYFFVEEKLGFTPEGEGEHVFLFVEKIGMNTQYVADQLAVIANVAKRQVSYSGMKDRHAVTRQWFSVHLPGNKSVDWALINRDCLTVLKVTRHRKKLRRGIHSGNFFRIKLTQLTGNMSELNSRLNVVSLRGVPNYFGEQRFGHNGANLRQAIKWFAGDFVPKRHQRSIYLSAVRSYLFNQVLSKRVGDKTWDSICSADIVMLNGTRSVFKTVEEDLTDRLRVGDIHPTGPLYGQTNHKTTDDYVAVLEKKVLEEHPTLTNGLGKASLKHERRSLRMIPTDFLWQLSYTDDTEDTNSLQVSFFLHKGCFATSLLRELVNYEITQNHVGI